MALCSAAQVFVWEILQFYALFDSSALVCENFILASQAQPQYIVKPARKVDFVLSMSVEQERLDLEQRKWLWLTLYEDPQ